MTKTMYGMRSGPVWRSLYCAMLRALLRARSRYRRSISLVAQYSALRILSESVMTSVMRCGTAPNDVKSTRLRSPISKRTSSGVAFSSRLQRIDEIETLFPDPVCPATRRCGIAARSSTMGEPATSRPSATVSFDPDCLNTLVSTTSRSDTRPTAMFGTSMPTTLFPGMGASMRSVRAASASARSSFSASIRESFTPAAGFSS